jgi:hypothetical protein
METKLAKLYILTKEQIESGKRPKTPRQKQRAWAKICIILAAIIVLENIALLWLGKF